MYLFNNEIIKNLKRNTVFQIKEISKLSQFQRNPRYFKLN